MAKKKINGLERKNWKSGFTLIGKAKVSDKTFTFDKESEKTDWIYNTMNLIIDCGEKCGDVFCTLMGGYGSERENKIFVHGKNEDGTDDFNAKIEVAWEDRFDEDVLETIGDLSLFTVGLEKTADKKTYYKKFLSAYDAIKYISENLKDGMVVNVKGNLKYQYYNGNVSVKKEVTSIVLSKVEEEKDFCAKFKQSILIDKDSIGAVDKSKNVLLIRAKVLEYMATMNGYEIQGDKYIPLPKTFEYACDVTNEALLTGIKNKLFSVSRDVSKVDFEGVFVESGATVKLTEDDLSDDIKQLIAIGAYTLEEALEDASADGGVDRRMVLTKPLLVKANLEEKTKATISKVDRLFTEAEINLPCLKAEEADEELETDEDGFVKISDDDDMAWRNDVE